MKQLWLHSVKLYISIGLFFYFRRIKTFGLERIPIDQPLLVLSNHQNALLDAVLIASKMNQFAYFLTRAGVFQKKWVSPILKSLNMLPVYRIRDGWSKLTNNNPVFEKCTELLNENETVVIFPEGSHNLARRVRPLSKGFTRIVFDTMNTYPNINLHLLPVGLNFENATQFAHSTAIYIGTPIMAKDYTENHAKDQVLRLRQDVQTALTTLTAHIPEEKYDKTLNQLDKLNVDYLNPKAVNECINNDFINCKSRGEHSFTKTRKLLQAILKINIFLPYLLWKIFIQPKIKELEFTSTFRFAVAITLVPIFLIVMSFIIAAYLGLTIALMYFLSILLLALVSVKL